MSMSTDVGKESSDYDDEMRRKRIFSFHIHDSDDSYGEEKMIE